MDSTLVTHIRFLIEDTGTPPDVTDVQIDNIAKSRRIELYYVSFDTDDYLKWTSEYDYVEFTTVSNTHEGAAVTPASTDPIDGTVTFATVQSAVYVKGYAYDLVDIAANLWLVKAGLADTLQYTLGDENVDGVAVKEKAVGMYWKFRTSKGGRLRRS